MEEVKKIYFHSNGDPSVGMYGWSGHIQFDDGDFPVQDNRNKKDIRSLLEETIGELIDQEVDIEFDFEREERLERRYKIYLLDKISEVLHIAYPNQAISKIKFRKRNNNENSMSCYIGSEEFYLSSLMDKPRKEIYKLLNERSYNG